MNTGYMSEKIRTDVAVIGGGAAGMMAALQAAKAGVSVILLEKNEKLGKKIYITGKGRCNVTNTADLSEFMRQVPRNPKFLNSAVHAFYNEDMIRLLDDLGTKTKVERGGRVFPVSDHASDVTRALTKGLERERVRVILNAEVKKVETADGGFCVTLQDGREIEADACIVATGGLSYSGTGSTGDGYRFAESFGLEVTPLKGSLVGLTTEERWPSLLQGLSLKNVRLTAKAGKKSIYDELGEMLFTHFGFSGPLCIELSSHLPDDLSAVSITLDLKPGMTEEEVDKRFQREFADAPKKYMSSILQQWLPARFCPVFCSLSGIAPETFAAEINRTQRMRLVQTMKRLTLPVSGLRPIEEAIVTRGGVNTRELSPSTMMSKQIPGLFFAGEVIDVDAHTGGFNLQIAFSTGALAGRSAASYIKGE